MHRHASHSRPDGYQGPAHYDPAGRGWAGYGKEQGPPESAFQLPPGYAPGFEPLRFHPDEVRPDHRSHAGFSVYSGMGDDDAWTRDLPGPTPVSHAGKGPRHQRSDVTVREDVCEALAYDEALDATGIDVTVDDGEVTLRGTVGSRKEKRLAELVAAQVRGVRDVHNELRCEQSLGDERPRLDPHPVTRFRLHPGG
jgi:hypothetical protein